MAVDGLLAARLQDIGCLACLMDGIAGVPSDLHHPLNGYRMGQGVVAPLCLWHHRGICEGNPEDWAVRHGPSLAHHRRRFRARYGTDAELLEFATDLLTKSYGGTE
jgi:hypothetical protein